MIRCVRAELNKAFKNRMFLISLGIGLLICEVDVIQNALTVRSLTETMLSLDDISKSAEGFSLFVEWIAVNGSTFGNMVFYFVWPILAVLPFGWSYAEERKSGLFDQIVSRVGRKTYFVSKYTAVFVSGGAAVALPVLTDLLVNALICPYCVPDVVTSITPITNGYFLSHLFFTSPWAFALLWCGMEFLWGGVVACICFVAGTRLRHQVMVLLIPFVTLVLLDAVCSLLMGVGTGNIELSPMRLVQAAPFSSNPRWLLLSYLGFFFAVTFIGGYRKVVKHELT